MKAVKPAELAASLRQLYPRVLIQTLGLVPALPDAEDAVHAAFERAAASWFKSGAPDSPEVWLVSVASNQQRDRRRRRETPRADALEPLAHLNPWGANNDRAELAQASHADRLPLLLACCQPELEAEENAALALINVVPWSTSELARAFVISPPDMEQRLERARQRLREAADARGSVALAAGERLTAALGALYFAFNEGYRATQDQAPTRLALREIALGLARALAAAFPATTEAAGLLALLLLHEAQRGARFTAEGQALALAQQDRQHWDREAIAAATALLERALAQNQAGPFQIEAAIAAVHCQSSSVEETDWKEVAELYALLERLRPVPAVRINHAFALARAQGPALGLALLENNELIDTSSSPQLHLVRGTLLGELGRNAEAKAALLLAAALAHSPHERAQIRAQLNLLDLTDP